LRFVAPKAHVLVHNVVYKVYDILNRLLALLSDIKPLLGLRLSLGHSGLLLMHTWPNPCG
jgi:hypothetical protein